MIHLKVVGRREEPVQVPVAGGPVGMPQQYTWGTRAMLVLMAVDEDGNSVSPNNEQINVPAAHFEDLAEYETSAVYALTPV
jgi:hypothetical protein